MRIVSFMQLHAVRFCRLFLPYDRLLSLYDSSLPTQRGRVMKQAGGQREDSGLSTNQTDAFVCQKLGRRASQHRGARRGCNKVDSKHNRFSLPMRQTWQPGEARSMKRRKRLFFPMKFMNVEEKHSCKCEHAGTFHLGLNKHWTTVSNSETT